MTAPLIECLFSEKKAYVFPVDMKSRFYEYKSQNRNKTSVLTDGSKRGDKVGFGLAATPLEYSICLPEKLFILTAEATALLAVVNIFVIEKRSSIVIYSDSKAILQALRNVYITTQHTAS